MFVLSHDHCGFLKYMCVCVWQHALRYLYWELFCSTVNDFFHLMHTLYMYMNISTHEYCLQVPVVVYWRKVWCLRESEMGMWGQREPWWEQCVEYGSADLVPMFALSVAMDQLAVMTVCVGMDTCWRGRAAMSSEGHWSLWEKGRRERTWGDRLRKRAWRFVWAGHSGLLVFISLPLGWGDSRHPCLFMIVSYFRHWSLWYVCNRVDGLQSIFMSSFSHHIISLFFIVMLDVFITTCTIKTLLQALCMCIIACVWNVLEKDHWIPLIYNCNLMLCKSMY